MSISLIAFSDAKPAELLAAYLNSQDIEAHVVFIKNTDSVDAQSAQKQPLPSASNSSDNNDTASNDKTQSSASHSAQSGYQVVIGDQNQIASATQIIKDFLEKPNQPKFQDSAWEQGHISSGSASNGAHGPSAVVQALYLSKKTPFTVFVLIVCCVVFLLSFLGYFPAVQDALEIRPVSELTQSHEWWRLVGPNFMHFSLMHIAFNLVWWWMLGRQIELSFGSSALIMFFVIASLFSNIAQLLVSGPNFGGLSGIVYALVGFVWWIGWLRPSWLISLPKNIIYFLLGWLALGYFDVLWVNMANEAHTFGLISGCLMALIIHLGSPKTRKK